MLLAANSDPVEEFTAVLATDVVPVPWRRSNAPRRWRCCWPSARATGVGGQRRGYRTDQLLGETDRGSRVRVMMVVVAVHPFGWVR
jgi:hypothetical protein